MVVGAVNYQWFRYLIYVLNQTGVLEPVYEVWLLYNLFIFHGFFLNFGAIPAIIIVLVAGKAEL